MSKRKKKPSKHVKSNAGRKVRQAENSAVRENISGLDFFLTNRIFIYAILLFSIALYGMTFSYGFVLDDKIVYIDNAFVKNGFGGIRKILSEESFTGFYGDQKEIVVGARYRPLSLITFAIEYQLFGLAPGLSHFINALLYGLTAILVFYLCTVFWPAKNPRPWYLSVGFWAALIFVAHPIHTEVVANIKGRDEILALLFSLLTLVYSLKIIKRRWDYFLMAVFFYAGLLAKENTITFLAVIPITMLVFGRMKNKKRSILTVAGILCGVTVLYLAQRYIVIGYLLGNGANITELMNNPFVNMGFGEKFATIFYTLGKYIKLLFWPNPLSYDYYPYAIATQSWSSIGSLASLIIYIGGGIAAVFGLLKKRVWAYAVLFYLFTLSIVSNIPFTVGAPMNERFMYMPSVAFALVLSYYLLNIKSLKGIPIRNIGLLILSFIICAFSLLTLIRIPVWKSDRALNEAALKVYPNSARANLKMGESIFSETMALSDTSDQRIGFQSSRNFINRALELYPAYGEALNMKAGVAIELFYLSGNIQKVFDVLQEVLFVEPGNQHVHGFLDFIQNDGRANAELLRFYYQLGFVEFSERLGQHQLGARFLEKALTIDATNPTILEALRRIRNR